MFVHMDNAPYTVTVLSLANPWSQPIECSTLQEVDRALDDLPFGACREVRDCTGALVDDYIPF